MVDKINYNEALNHSGWLHKKSSSVFGVFQKRFFTISSENKLIFSENEGGKIKGSFDLDFSNVTSENEKCFKLAVGEKEFIFRAENSEEKNKWINSLEAIISFGRKNSPSTSRTLEPSILSKKIFEVNIHVIKNQLDSTDHELSRKCLDLKGLSLFLDKLPKDLVESRIIYGFLKKSHKSTPDLFQKRWFFLISPRPLTDSTYDIDESILDEIMLPPEINFDCLYYYKAECENDRSEAVGKIDLKDNQGIELKEKEGKFYILIETNMRKYELLTENTVERKKWYEALKCSSLTAREYKNSLSKRPRNIGKLAKLMDKGGIEKVKDICEEEKRKIISEFKRENKMNINDLKENCNKIGSLLFETIDGCLLKVPSCVDLLKIYVNSLSCQIFDEVKMFWNTNYKIMNNSELIDLGNILYNYEEKLSNYGVIDPNFSLSNICLTVDGRELFKIFSKKNYLEMKKELESIMKLERQMNIVKEEEILFTVFPNMIFKHIYTTYDLIKDTQNRQLFEFFITIVKEIILNYILVSDNFINNQNYFLNTNYIISISNNSAKLNNLIDDFIINLTKEYVLQDNEIVEFLKKNNLCNWLNILSNNAIFRLISDQFVTISHIFMNQPFITILLNENIFNLIKETFEKFEKFFFSYLKKTFWTEIFHITFFYYLCSLLKSGLVNVKEFEEIKSKLITDKDLFITFFGSYFEKFILTDVLRIIDDILEILASPRDLLSNCCFKLRKMHGSNFSFILAKSLINLRMDLTLNNKQVVNLEIKELFEKNSLNETNVQRNNSRILSLINDQMTEKTHRKDEKPNELRRHTKTVADHIKDLHTVKKDENEENELDFISYSSVRNEKPLSEKKVISGYIKKKSNSEWQERFYVIKNSFIYCYESADSNEFQNYLNLGDCKKVQSYKPTRFLLFVGDKTYKFDCENEEIKNEWINVINSEINKIKGKKERRVEIVYQVKLRKKMITDILKLPNVTCDVKEISKYVNEIISKETDFFKEKKVKIEENTWKNNNNTTSTLNLDEGFLSKEKKRTSIFNCCQKCFSIFNKKKKYNEFEEHQK